MSIPHFSILVMATRQSLSRTYLLNIMSAEISDSTTQWTLSNAPTSVKTWLEMWTQTVCLTTGSSSIEAELMLSLASAEDQEVAQFQLACIHKEMNDLLDIHASEPLPILDHLKYIWGCLRGCKIAKTLVQEQIRELKQQRLEQETQQNELIRLQQDKETLTQQLEILFCTDASARKVHFLETKLEKTENSLQTAEAENCRLGKSLQDQLLYFATQINAAKRQILVAKTKETVLQSQLNVAIDQSAYLGKVLQSINARASSLEEEVLAYSEQIQELKDTIETERQSKAYQEEQAQQKIASISLRTSHLEANNAKIEHTMRSQMQTIDRQEQVIQQFAQKLEIANMHINELIKRQDSNYCVVCFEAAPCVLFQPCKHACVCETCSAKFNTCPKCRTNIGTRQKIFL